jgi:hypothetical protein
MTQGQPGNPPPDVRSTIKINAGTRFRSLTFCHDAIEIKGLAATKKNPEQSTHSGFAEFVAST